MVVTVMKTNFRKPKPKIINYRNYRYFPNDRFREKGKYELSKVVLENSDKGFNKFLDVCKEALNMYDPLKKKYIRGNNSPFMKRILIKEIIKRSRLRNKFLRVNVKLTKKTTSNKEIIVGFYLGERKRNTMETLTLEKLRTTEHFGEQLNLSFPINPLKIKNYFGRKGRSSYKR